MRAGSQAGNCTQKCDALFKIPSQQCSHDSDGTYTPPTAEIAVLAVTTLQLPVMSNAFGRSDLSTPSIRHAQGG